MVKLSGVGVKLGWYYESQMAFGVTFMPQDSSVSTWGATLSTVDISLHTMHMLILLMCWTRMWPSWVVMAYAYLLHVHPNRPIYWWQ